MSFKEALKLGLVQCEKLQCAHSFLISDLTFLARTAVPQTMNGCAAEVSMVWSKPEKVALNGSTNKFDKD